MYKFASGITGLVIGGAVGGFGAFLPTGGYLHLPFFFVGIVLGAPIGCLAAVKIAEKVVDSTRLDERTILLLNAAAWICGFGWFLMETYAGW